MGLDRVEDGTAATAIRNSFAMLIEGKATGPLVVKILRSFVQDDLHKEALSFLLLRLKNALEEKEDTLRSFIQRRVTEQGGRVVGWMIGPSVAQKVITSLYNELQRIDPSDPEVRENVTEWLRKEIDLLERDPERRAKVETALTQILRHDSILAWSGQIWRRLRTRIEQDSHQDDGVTAGFIDASLMSLSRYLRHDYALVQKVDGTVSTAFTRMLPNIRDHLANYVTDVMSKWDGASLAHRIEERIGKDLQYIRINGTLVGFTIGAILEAVSRAFHFPMG
ncbi:uncharacterized protein LOC108865089 [Galendromus occidentalis]|uniref:Uncharacterized protein LOC108865089 n=1 Tax=Galendromus occidentalis TaxID=34638 RepID=A0AAJ7PB03_9ACAR|nr:uncharacterized protein LOC108865089 [Galendromus occidentalis]